VNGSSDADHIDRALRIARLLANADAAGVALPHAAAPGDGEPFDPSEALLAAVRLKESVVAADLAADEHFPDTAMQFFAGVRLDLPSASEPGVLWVASRRAGAPDPTVVPALADVGWMLAQQIATADSLALGREIQKELLPPHPPRVPGYELAAHSMPSQELAGDFYDWWLVDGSLRIVLADVMGKGVGSSLVAAGVRSMMHAALTYHPPADAVTRVSGDLETDFDRTARFATCFVADLAHATGELRWVDAGHGIAVVLHADGTYKHLAGTDLPLGALPGLAWQQHTTRLGPGDALFAASDGVLERFDELSDVLAAARELYLDGVGLADLVARIGGDRPADDDVTIVGIRREADAGSAT
jgi:hypothetical protein